MPKMPSLKNLNMDVQLHSQEAYEKELKGLQQDMLRIQQAYFHQKRRAVVVFEGWDAAGKGGAIRRVTEKLDPRGFVVWPIAKPAVEDQARHHLFRFWARIPAPGCISLFDRSWYGRVMVERVEGLCTKPEWMRAYGELNSFEKALTDDGVRVIKLFLHITPEEQLERFRERLTNPQKRWKMTEEDIRNRLRWKDYEEAVEDMLRKTHTTHAPWKVIAANAKWYARVEVLRSITQHLAHGVDVSVPPLDPHLQREAARKLGIRLPRQKN